MSFYCLSVSILFFVNHTVNCSTFDVIMNNYLTEHIIILYILEGSDSVNGIAYMYVLTVIVITHMKKREKCHEKR